MSSQCTKTTWIKNDNDLSSYVAQFAEAYELYTHEYDDGWFSIWRDGAQTLEYPPLAPFSNHLLVPHP